MKLLSIGFIRPIEGIEDRLKLEIDLLRDKGLDIVLRKHSSGNAILFCCHVDDDIMLKENYFNKIRSKFANSIANALSDIVINYWEPILIKKIIRENYFYFNKSEQSKIYFYANDILNYNNGPEACNSGYLINRKSLVLHKIREYLDHNNFLILDGFINFRLKEYIKQLEECVDIAIDEYLIHKEYKEFIKLLRHFVELQEPKMECVNVVFKNNKIVLIDENLDLIESDSTLELIAKENPEVNLDDIIVSNLINIAPKKIIIHGFSGKEKREIVDTLYNIFDGRIVFCHNCSICSRAQSLTKNKRP